jgi:hypothetical protein
MKITLKKKKKKVSEDVYQFYSFKRELSEKKIHFLIKHKNSHLGFIEITLFLSIIYIHLLVIAQNIPILSQNREIQSPGTTKKSPSVQLLKTINTIMQNTITSFTPLSNNN